MIENSYLVVAELFLTRLSTAEYLYKLSMIEKPFTEESIKLGTGRVLIWAKQDRVNNFHNKMVRLVCRIFLNEASKNTEKLG